MGGDPLCGAIPGNFRFSPGAQMTPEGGLCINRSPWALGGACVPINLADKVLWPGLQYSSSVESSPSLVILHSRKCCALALVWVD